MDLLEDLIMSLLNFNFVMIYIIYKILVLLKNNRITSKIVFSNAFLRSIINFFFSKVLFFSQHIMMENLSHEEEKIIKYIRNLFR